MTAQSREGWQVRKQGRGGIACSAAATERKKKKRMEMQDEMLVKEEEEEEGSGWEGCGGEYIGIAP